MNQSEDLIKNYYKADMNPIIISVVIAVIEILWVDEVLSFGVESESPEDVDTTLTIPEILSASLKSPNIAFDIGKGFIQQVTIWSEVGKFPEVTPAARNSYSNDKIKGSAEVPEPEIEQFDVDPSSPKAVEAVPPAGLVVSQEAILTLDLKGQFLLHYL